MVCGSRGWTNADIVLDVIAGYSEGWRIIQGGAKGADEYAKAAAKFLDIPVETYKPNYLIFGRRAPHVRNDRMLKLADKVLVFWDGDSLGTKSVIEKARKRGLEVEVVR